MTERTDIAKLRSDRPVRWTAAGAVVIAALCVRPWLPAWALMWLTTAALFFGFKILAVRAPVDWRWLLLWPGMDPRPFQIESRRKLSASPLKPLLLAMVGAVLVWGIARRAAAPLFAGWIGMMGLILILHFGVMDLLAWRGGKRA